MAEQLHSTAVHHLPAFITAPGESDVLMVVMAFFLGLCVFGFGIFFLRLHTLPERIAHKTQKVQFEIVAILGLISLFTHMHIFWIIGLLLAFVEIPDFGGLLGRIAGSVERIADPKHPSSEVDEVASTLGMHRDDESSTAKTPTRVAGRKELDHA